MLLTYEQKHRRGLRPTALQAMKSFEKSGYGPYIDRKVSFLLKKCLSLFVGGVLWCLCATRVLD